jgi:hypothetical protein
MRIVREETRRKEPQQKGEGMTKSVKGQDPKFKYKTEWANQRPKSKEAQKGPLISKAKEEQTVLRRKNQRGTSIQFPGLAGRVLRRDLHRRGWDEAYMNQVPNEC